MFILTHNRNRFHRFQLFFQWFLHVKTGS